MVANIVSQADYEALTKVVDLLGKLAVPGGATSLVADLVQAKKDADVSLNALSVAQNARETDLQVREKALGSREAAVDEREKASAIVDARLQAVKDRIAKANAALTG
jgi:hypothetical protein